MRREPVFDDCEEGTAIVWTAEWITRCKRSMAAKGIRLTDWTFVTENRPSLESEGEVSKVILFQTVLLLGLRVWRVADCRLEGVAEIQRGMGRPECADAYRESCPNGL